MTFNTRNQDSLKRYRDLFFLAFLFLLKLPVFNGVSRSHVIDRALVAATAKWGGNKNKTKPKRHEEAAESDRLENDTGRAALLVPVGRRGVVHLAHDLREQLVH